MNEESSVAGAVFTLFLGIVFLVCALFTGGTFRTELSYVRPGAEATVVDERPLQTFTSRHWIWGLIQGHQPDLQSALQALVQPNQEVTRMMIVTKHSVTDALLTGVTLGIYSPQTVTVRTFVRRRQASLH
jgi:hypothetical protein